MAVRLPELLIWAYSLIHTLAGINLLGLPVDLAAYPFRSSRCCKKKWQQSKWALSKLPEHDQLLTVLAKPTELACFSVMVHISWHCANSYCKPAGIKWGIFTCQRRRAQEISENASQPSSPPPTPSETSSITLGKFSPSWRPHRQQYLTLSWWEGETKAVSHSVAKG